MVARRVRFHLQHLKEKLHATEGLLVALEHMPSIIRTIQQSNSSQSAKENIFHDMQYNLTHSQVQHEAPIPSAYNR